MLEMVDAVALQPLLIPAGQVAKDETFTTTKAHAEELIGMGLAKPAKGGKAKAEGAKDG